MFEKRTYEAIDRLSNRPGTTTALFEKILADLMIPTELNTHEVFECQPRDQKIREILNYSLTMPCPVDCVIQSPARKINKAYLLSEFVWYLSGNPDPTPVSHLAPFWNTLRDKDGLVSSNYGTRIFGQGNHPYFPEINQFENVLRALTEDRDSRQAIMTINAAPDLRVGNKDVPCTYSLQFLIRNNELQMIVNMRSNDVIMGFGNDVFQFSMIMQMVRAEFNRRNDDNVRLGSYHHNAGSMHIYERHFEMAEEILAHRAFNNEHANGHAVLSHEQSLGHMPASTYMSDRIHLVTLERWIRENSTFSNFNVPVDVLEDLGAYRSLDPWWQHLVRYHWGLET